MLGALLSVVDRVPGALLPRARPRVPLPLPPNPSPPPNQALSFPVSALVYYFATGEWIDLFTQDGQACAPGQG